MEILQWIYFQLPKFCGNKSDMQKIVELLIRLLSRNTSDYAKLVEIIPTRLKWKLIRHPKWKLIRGSVFLRHTTGSWTANKVHLLCDPLIQAQVKKEWHHSPFPFCLLGIVEKGNSNFFSLQWLLNNIKQYLLQRNFLPEKQSK